MTEISRRAAMRAGAAAVVLGPLATVHPASAAGTTENLYRRSRFAALLNATFKLSDATTSASVVLTRVGDLPSAAAGDDSCFVLTFASAKAGPPQGTFVLRRSGFTPTTLFLVPSDAARRTLQVIVNRLS